MKYSLIPIALLGALLPAQEAGSVSYQIPDTRTHIKTSEDKGVIRSFLSRDGGETWVSQNPVDTSLHMRGGTFDPKSPPAFTSDLMSGPDSKLFIVQCKTQIIREFRSALKAVGAEIKQFMPSQSYLVRLERSQVSKVRAMPFVRSVLDYHQGFRLEPAIIANLGANRALQQRYIIVMVDKKTDSQTAVAAAEAAGARIDMFPMEASCSKPPWTRTHCFGLLPMTRYCLLSVGARRKRMSTTAASKVEPTTWRPWLASTAKECSVTFAKVSTRLTLSL
jgi:hypothetical protein